MVTESKSLQLAELPVDAIFLLRFRYPKLYRTGDVIQKMKYYNLNYSAYGDDSIAPIRVFDNGQFTYFDFSDKQTLPAIFIANKKGKESLVNYHQQGRYVVVERTAQQFDLRHGSLVATVFNETVKKRS